MPNTQVPALPDSQAADQAWQCHEYRVKHWPLRKIAQAVGLSESTVRRRLDWANKQLLLPGVLEHRKLQDERYGNLLALVMEDVARVVDDPDTGTKRRVINYEAVRAATVLIDKLSELHGTKAPIQAEIKMIEITPEDVAMVEEINRMVAEQMLQNGRTIPGEYVEN